MRSWFGLVCKHDPPPGPTHPPYDCGGVERFQPQAHGPHSCTQRKTTCSTTQTSNHSSPPHRRRGPVNRTPRSAPHRTRHRLGSQNRKRISRDGGAYWHAAPSLAPPRQPHHLPRRAHCAHSHAPNSLSLRARPAREQHASPQQWCTASALSSRLSPFSYGSMHAPPLLTPGRQSYHGARAALRAQCNPPLHTRYCSVPSACQPTAPPSRPPTPARSRPSAHARRSRRRHSHLTQY